MSCIIEYMYNYVNTLFCCHLSLTLTTSSYSYSLSHTLTQQVQSTLALKLVRLSTRPSGMLHRWSSPLTKSSQSMISGSVFIPKTTMEQGDHCRQLHKEMMCKCRCLYVIILFTYAEFLILDLAVTMLHFFSYMVLPLLLCLM